MGQTEIFATAIAGGSKHHRQKVMVVKAQSICPLLPVA